MRTRLAVVVISAGVLCAAHAPAATYIYRGMPFTEAGAPYQLGQRVSGTLELVQALPANMAATDIPIADFVDLQFVDGQQLRSGQNTTICRLVLGTNAQGNINAWMVWLRADTVGVGNARASLETYNIPGFTADLVGVGVFPGACDAGALNPRALTTDAGSWLPDALFVSGFED